VRTVWPLQQQYVICHLEPDYSVAIVARDARDYVWILAREPEMDDRRFAAYRQQIEAIGYDMTKFSRYPQDGSMPNDSDRPGRAADSDS
jgi:apolipoprotein D and lipocalin family protein